MKRRPKPNPEPEHLALLLALGAYDALTHYGAETKEEAWALLDDHKRVVVLSENADCWTDAFEHELVGFELADVPGVPAGWTTHLWAADGGVGAQFIGVDGVTEHAVDRPSDLRLKQAGYERFLRERTEVAAELWRVVETRRQAAA